MGDAWSFSPVMSSGGGPDGVLRPQLRHHGDRGLARSAPGARSRHRARLDAGRSPRSAVLAVMGVGRRAPACSAVRSTPCRAFICGSCRPISRRTRNGTSKHREDVLLKYMTMSSDKNVSESDVTIIWPESSIPYFIDQEVGPPGFDRPAGAAGRSCHSRRAALPPATTTARSISGTASRCWTRRAVSSRSTTRRIWCRSASTCRCAGSSRRSGIDKLVEVGDGDFLAGPGPQDDRRPRPAAVLAADLLRGDLSRARSPTSATTRPGSSTSPTTPGSATARGRDSISPWCGCGRSRKAFPWCAPP